MAVINERAGGNKPAHSWPGIQAKLIRNGVALDSRVTEKAGHAQEIARQALREGYTGVIAVGGDGTLSEVANGFWQEGQLTNPDAVLSFVNLGTGGDFARTVCSKPVSTDSEKDAGIPDAADRLLTGRLRQVDVGLGNFGEGGIGGSRYFVNVANVGVGAEAVVRVNNQKSKFGGGRISFLRGTLGALLAYKPKPMCIVVDGEVRIDEEIYSAMVCNGRYIGAGMMIAPEAEITDGLFDIVAIQKMPLIRLLILFPKIYSGAHIGIKGVKVWQGSQVEIADRQTGSIVELDGDTPGFGLPASYRLLPRAMNFWLPA
jgi:YegS/Rv2252/BmrU family lipid kinase